MLLYLTAGERVSRISFLRALYRTRNTADGNLEQFLYRPLSLRALYSSAKGIKASRTARDVCRTRLFLNGFIDAVF